MRRLPLALSGGGGKNFLGMLLHACLILTRRVLDHLRVGRENMKRRQDCECGCLGADPLGQGDAVLDSLSGSSPSSRSSQRVHLRFFKWPGRPRAFFVFKDESRDQ